MSSAFGFIVKHGRRSFLSGLLAAAFVLPLAPGNSAFAQETWKVAWIQVGPVGDAGWTYQQDLARREIDERLDWVETMQVESVGPSDMQRVIEDFVAQGAKVLVVQDPTVMDLVLDLGRKYPDRYFLVANGYKSSENVGGFYGHMEQPYYLAGLVAGKMTKSDTIGFVGPFPVPTVVQAIDGFALGVKEVNPEAKIKLVWTQSWYDPPREREAAQSLINVGADVVAQYADSPAVVQTAEAAGVWAIGSNSDLSEFGPNAYLTGQIWYWTDLYETLLTELREGTWEPGTRWGDLADGTVRLGPLHEDIPDDVVALVKESAEKIKNDELRIFTGPISDNNGQVQVPEGKALAENELHGLNWLVDNIEGSIPK